MVVLALALGLAVPGPTAPPVASEPTRPDSLRGPSSALDPAAQADLSRAVPSDVSLYFHARLPSDPSSDTVFDTLRRALSTASFIAPFASYLDDVVLAGRRSALDVELEYWRRLLEQPSWWRLFRREFFLAGRLEIEIHEPNLEIYRRGWLMGFRVEPGEREPFLDAMGEMLEACAAVVPGSELDVGRRDGSGVVCLYSLFQPSLEFCVTGRDGLILLSTSRSLLRQSMQLLSGDSSDISFALNRTAESDTVDASSRSSLAWLSSRSRFLSANLSTADSPSSPAAPAGFELMVEPMELFADLLRDDPLLVDWKSLNVAGDFREAGIQCYFDTDLPAGKDELERVLSRALLEPIERLRPGPILYREVGALLPTADDELEPPEVTVLVRELARWLWSAIGVLDSGGGSATAETVTVREGVKRLRGEATFPLVVRESARRG